MPLRYIDDPGYELGMIRDAPSWRLPAGAVYDAQNVVFDKPGVARQRGGTTNLVSGAQTAFATSMGWAYSQDATPVEELYGVDGRTGTLYVINKTTGAATSLGSALGVAANVGRAVRHFGYTVFPSAATSFSIMPAVYVAGQTVTASFTSTSPVTVTAGTPTINLGGADTTTNMRVGARFGATTASLSYQGRIVSINSGTQFTVWPVPTQTVVAAAGFSTSSAFGALSQGTGRCATSFQNRLLFGNALDMNAAATSGQALRNDRRVNYSVLPTETGIQGGTTTITGAAFILSDSWPVLNYFDVPGADPIVAMEPTGDNELLILTSTHPVLFRGNLVTQLATTNPTITFDISDINQPAGCLSEFSVQRTPRGIVWAGHGGIYAYNGGQINDLTRGTISTYWRSLATGSAFAVHGSMYVRGHYVISGTSGGSTFSLACDITAQTPHWTRLSGAGTDILYGLSRPTNPAQVYALRWWDQASAAPSMTNGQTIRAETMLDPYTPGSTRTDSDGAAVSVSVTTRVLTGDAETQKVFQRGTIRYQQASTTAAVTVTAQSKIDAADISSASVRTLGALSNTSPLTITAATNATPIVITTSVAHGLQDDDFVDIDGVTGNTNANGRWRIDVLSATTFHLVGSAGNGVMGGSPSCKKVTETDYQMSGLNPGQGVSVTVAGSPNNFELHGVRVAMLERAPVMSS